MLLEVKFSVVHVNAQFLLLSLSMSKENDKLNIGPNKEFVAHLEMAWQPCMLAITDAYHHPFSTGCGMFG